jgi:hypothetical protein
MSYDDGKTWPDARIIFPYTTAYSDITVLPDGRIGVLFERDNHSKIDLAILNGVRLVLAPELGPRKERADVKQVEAFNRIEAEQAVAKANLSATKPADRMKSWAQHVKLREESIFKDLKWLPVGPRIQGGKIESIWSPKGHKSTIYAGVGSGNLWKTVNNGTTWKPVFENESTFSVAVVTVSDKDPNLVWVGTGEPHMARSSFAGTGVFKSTDGAKTWKHMGLVDTHHIGRVLIDPEDSNVVYVAALGHQYTHNKARGLFKTTDGGKTWQKSLYISEKVGVVEVAMDPSDNKTLYAIAWERDRKAWNNVDAGPGSGLYKIPRTTRPFTPSPGSATGRPGTMSTPDQAAGSTRQPTRARPGSGSPTGFPKERTPAGCASPSRPPTRKLYTSSHPSRVAKSIAPTTRAKAGAGHTRETSRPG